MTAKHASGHVRVIERKNGAVFYAKLRLPDGSAPQRALGRVWAKRTRPPAGYLTRKQAEAQLQAMLEGELVETRSSTRSPGGKRTFGQAVAEWLRYVEGLERAESTLGDYRSVAKALERELGTDTPVDEITTGVVDELRIGRSRRTQQKHLIALHGVMARAVNRGWIDVNPCARAEKITVKASGDFNFLSSSEVMATARAADDLMGAVIIVAAFTGLRLGELRALRWMDVDFAGATIHARRNRPGSYSEKAPKSGKVRSLPLVDEAARALDALSRREHYTDATARCFTVTGGMLDEGDVRDAFYAALEGAGLGRLRTKSDPIVFHDLRHTFGTMMARLGVDVVSIQAWMGHADIATTQRYMHYSPKAGVAAELSAKIAAELQPGCAPDYAPNVRHAGVTERN
jgi:integrase